MSTVNAVVKDPTSISWPDVFNLAGDVAEDIRLHQQKRLTFEGRYFPVAYPIPRGGVYAALALKRFIPSLIIAEHPAAADFFIDDIEDSGRTRLDYSVRYPGVPFYSLTVKGDRDWVTFPWERMSNENGPQENIRRLIEYIGDDPNREGLLETPDRVVRSYAELFSGYQYKTDEDISKVMKVFEDGACDEMVLLKGVPFFSHCEHHMLTFSGVAHVAYLPDKKIIGLSKLARIVDIFAHRLQVQERLTTQITATLDQHLAPRGSACMIEASHSCMKCRGVRKQGSTMVTSSITGDFRKPEVRAEFYSLIKD